MYTKKILKNGLTILKVPIRGAKSVLVDVFVKVGSRSEERKVNGISHFLEHLFFKGSRKFPTAQELSHALDAIGASYNANTGKEHTQYYIKAAKKHLRFIFETLTDVIQNPSFAEEEIEREKGVIVEEINMYQDTPIRHVDDLLEEAMWPGQPLGRNIAGAKEVIRKITRDDISRYKETFYQPGNIILAVAGNFNESQLDGLIKKYWAHLPHRKFPTWTRSRSTKKGPVVLHEVKSTEQYHLEIGFNSFDYNDERNIAQMALAGILGGGMSSRLFTEIREHHGLAYYVQASAANYQDTGVFTVKAGLRIDALSEAVKMTVAELSKMKNVLVQEKELTKAKEYLKGTLTLALEDSENLLGWYLEQAAFRRKIYEAEGLFDQLDRVSSQSVRLVARDIFQNKTMHMALIGPAGRPVQRIKKLFRF